MTVGIAPQQQIKEQTIKIIVSIAASLCASLAFCAQAMAQDAKPKQSVLFTTTKIFDGTNEKLSDGMSVLVEGNKIAKIAKSIKAPDSAMVIDAKGPTLMPGFNDAHVHLGIQVAFQELLTLDESYFALPRPTRPRRCCCGDSRPRGTRRETRSC